MDILIVGLESTGKTEIAYKICREIRDEYLKTKGCRVFNTNSGNSANSLRNIQKFRICQVHDATQRFLSLLDGTNIRLTEVGGAPEFLDIWKYYFLDVSGFIEYIFVLLNEKYIFRC